MVLVDLVGLPHFKVTSFPQFNKQQQQQHFGYFGM